MSDYLNDLLSLVYGSMEGSDLAEEYATRHGVKSAAILTVHADELGAALAEYLRPRIEGKTVVEIGGGIGLLAMHMGDYAKRVYCIEASPAWAWTFVGTLYAKKPKHVSYLLGAADEFVGAIHADVAVFATHSGVGAMRRAAKQFAPAVIDVYGEIIHANPDAFDPLAVALRTGVPCARRDAPEASP